MDSFKVNINNLAEQIDSLLQNLFAAQSPAHQQLKQIIEREFRPNGSPEILRMEIDRVDYDKQSSNGRFRVVLDISYTFACEDVTKQKDNETSEWTFSVKDDVITFYSSPFIDSRSTADEF